MGGGGGGGICNKNNHIVCSKGSAEFPTRVYHRRRLLRRHRSYGFFLPAADNDAMSTSGFSFSNVYRIPLRDSLQRRRPLSSSQKVPTRRERRPGSQWQRQGGEATEILSRPTSTVYPHFLVIKINENCIV